MVCNFKGTQWNPNIQPFLSLCLDCGELLLFQTIIEDITKQ